MMKFQRPCVFGEAWLGTSGTIYNNNVEVFVGILFREIVKKLALRNFLGLNFREYIACLVLRLVTDKCSRFFIFMNAD